MRIVMFYHSLVSDWNHGNAHFLRGIVAELLARGHDVRVYEPRDAWSVEHLRREHGDKPINNFRLAYPNLDSTTYDLTTLNLDEALDTADLVLVHEWNDHALVRRIGAHRARAAANSYRLLFHDTHHRAITDRSSMAAYDLTHYDGVLAFGRVLRDLYLHEGWTERAWTWHEAADVRVFRPVGNADLKQASVFQSEIRDSHSAFEGDLVWIGNWGDDERTTELNEFLIEPIKKLNLRARVYGVRYPETAVQSLADAGIEYAGWLPNYEAPDVFARFKVTVHVPRRPYTEALPGIPTIRIFEALACGIPLISAPWDDAEHLFAPGADFLVARDGTEMTHLLKDLLANEPLRRELADHGLRTVCARHTCAHRIDELLAIYEQLTTSLVDGG